MTNAIAAPERLDAVIGAVLGDRVVSCIVYGSAATGDLLPGYSDVDLLVVVRTAVTLDDAMELHRQVVGVEINPFAYVQPTFVLDANVSPLFVPGTFVVLSGAEPPPGAIQSEADLRRNSAEWLADLPTLVCRDGADWALAAVDVPRRARLALTRLKPAVRALLVHHGEPPMEAWAMTWDAMLEQVADIDGEVYRQTADALAAVRSLVSDADDVGTAAMLALRRICALVARDGEEPLIISK